MPTRTSALETPAAEIIPEAPLYKSSRHEAVAKIALLAYDNKSREHVYSSGPLVGKSHYRHYLVLGYIKFKRTDLPERK